MKNKFNINQFKPCLDAAKYYDTCRSSKEAWNNCPRGDWMLWIALKLGVDVETLTLAKIYCALTIKHLIKNKRSIKALEVALKFANGKATLEELKIAVNSAYIVDNTVDNTVNNTVAYTAAYNIAVDEAAHNAIDDIVDDNVAYTATYSATAIYDAAYAATYTDAYTIANAAKIKNQLETAIICRKYLTKSVFEIIKFNQNE